jgi:hypothetical protein
VSDQLPLKILRVPQLGGTPFAGFAVQVNAALLDEGFADPFVSMVGWDTAAVVALSGRDLTPAGIITYADSKWRKCFDVGMGYVLPDWRRRGIYRAMWDELVLAAQEQKVARIYGAIMVSNAPMLKVAVALGRRVESHNVVFDVT